MEKITVKTVCTCGCGCQFALVTDGSKETATQTKICRKHLALKAS